MKMLKPIVNSNDILIEMMMLSAYVAVRVGLQANVKVKGE